DVLRDFPLPAIAVRQQALLVVIELLAGLGGELEIGALDDGVDRAGLLAHAAIDALDHVDVVAGGAAGAVVAARARLDGDRLRRADRLAQFAGDAALLAVGVAALRMLTAEARRDRSLLERIVQRRLGLEEVAHAEHEAGDELRQEDRAGRLIQSHGRISRLLISAPGRRTATRRRRSPPWPATPAGTPSSRAASAGRSGSAARSPSPWRRERT